MPYFATNDRTQLFFTDTGTGTPVVLVSSAWLSSRMWEFQLPHLAANGFRAVAYDRRGHGRSDWTWDGYDYDRLADDLASLLNHLDLHDVTLIGHSMGCGEAVRYLTRHGAGRLRAEMRAIDVPTLIVHGDRDVQAPLAICGRRSAELVPASRLVVYENAAHGLFVTHSGRLNADLTAFALGRT
jgi:non-heme chloroperoxidase